VQSRTFQRASASSTYLRKRQKSIRIEKQSGRASDQVLTKSLVSRIEFLPGWSFNVRFRTSLSADGRSPIAESTIPIDISHLAGASFGWKIAYSFHGGS